MMSVYLFICGVDRFWWQAFWKMATLLLTGAADLLQKNQSDQFSELEQHVRQGKTEFLLLCLAWTFVIGSLSLLWPSSSPSKVFGSTAVAQMFLYATSATFPCRVFSELYTNMLLPTPLNTHVSVCMFGLSAASHMTWILLGAKTTQDVHQQSSIEASGLHLDC